MEGQTNHETPGEKYGIFDEEHCSWKRAVWTAGERGADLNKLYPVRGW